VVRLSKKVYTKSSIAPFSAPYKQIERSHKFLFVKHEEKRTKSLPNQKYVNFVNQNSFHTMVTGRFSVARTVQNVMFGFNGLRDKH